MGERPSAEPAVPRRSLLFCGLWVPLRLPAPRCQLSPERGWPVPAKKDFFFPSPQPPSPPVLMGAAAKHFLGLELLGRDVLRTGAVPTAPSTCRASGDPGRLLGLPCKDLSDLSPTAPLQLCREPLASDLCFLPAPQARGGTCERTGCRRLGTCRKWKS